MPKFRITLAQLFSLSLLGLMALLACLFYLLFHASQESIIRSSNDLRAAASRQLAEKVTDYLAQVQKIVDSFQADINHEVFNPKDPIALETFLFASILTNPHLSEISLTYGKKTGYDVDGNIVLAPNDRGEMSLFRTSGSINTLYIYQKKRQWFSKERARSTQNDLFKPPFGKEQTLSIGRSHHTPNLHYPGKRAV